ncbi:GNAT family N-acetyltransferase [Pendulispora albinea]|uniref:GNAT family N-acetyltransferase n=1 Tax=Pendulispora albinea TaxID=2741071 RepID=A0ABZ2LQ60_9BACT
MVIIRPALDEDIAGVAALAAQLVRYHHGLDPLRFMQVPRVEEGYRHYLKGEMRSGDVVILVALREPEKPEDTRRPHVVGYTYSRVEPRNWNALLDRCGMIHDVFVAEEERRHGLARRLMHETIRHLEDLGIPRIVLYTATQNEQAQRLFASLGFRTTMLELTRETTHPPRRSVPPPSR